ncbi:hypothetical protein [Paenibacillus macquariensis]|uniref:Uncharacterized protein n=1 Tax=Paenibacillus macquariensis TaxID=948756 RepID=A0ABY1JX75_9BACL|nr:hypothetical protein [Paenibacillus macquariensis]MEC0089375.1 hypothetical protein [Paenibacillus macquariensis]SIQ92637.1 hypothetical protein SAMN05421578_10582 [Paenibacillus macquariensis]
MSDFISLSSTAKAHQLAMLYLENRYSGQKPSVDTLMTEYENALPEILARVQNIKL